MKKILLPLFIFFVFISAAFSQQTVKNELHKFQMTFPDDSKVTNKNTGLIALVAMLGKSASVNITVREMDTLKEGISEGYDFKPQADSLSIMYKSFFGNYKEMESGYVGISENIFYRMVYFYEIMKTKMWASQYMVAKYNKTYIITLACYEKDYNDYKLIFNDCISSFKFLE